MIWINLNLFFSLSINLSRKAIPTEAAVSASSYIHILTQQTSPEPLLCAKHWEHSLLNPPSLCFWKAYDLVWRSDRQRTDCKMWANATMLMCPKCCWRYSCFTLLKIILKYYLFIWLHQVLVAACRLLLVGSSFPEGASFPDQGSNLGPLHWELLVLATGPAGTSV